MRDYSHVIDGAFVASDGDDRIDVSYSYDGEVWASVPDGTKTDVDGAVTASREAFESWRKTRSQSGSTRCCRSRTRWRITVRNWRSPSRAKTAG